MFIAVLFLALAFILLLNVGTASAETTYVENDIVSDTVWNSTGSPYIVNDTVYVDNNASLTIESNVTVKFGPGAGLFVNGSLFVQGTADEPVNLTANTSMPTAGFWQGVVVPDVSQAAEIEYANISYADIAVDVRDSSVLLSNVWIWESSSAAIEWDANMGDLSATVSNVHVNHTGDGFRLGAFMGYNATIAVSDCSLNDVNGVGVYSIGEGTVVATMTDVAITDCDGPAFLADSMVDLTVSYSQVTVEGSFIGLSASSSGPADVSIADSSFMGTFGGLVMESFDDLEASLDNVTVTNAIEGITMMSDNGTVDASIVDVTVEQVSNAPIMMDGVEVVLSQFTGVNVIDSDDYAVTIHQDQDDYAIDISDVNVDSVYAPMYVDLNGSLSVSLTDCLFNDTVEGLRFMADGDVTVDLVNVTVTNVRDDSGIVAFTDLGTVDVSFDAVSVMNVDYSGILLDASIIELGTFNVSVSDCVEDGVRFMQSTGDVTFALDGLTISDCDGYGIYVYVHNGTADLQLDGLNFVNDSFGALAVESRYDSTVSLNDISVSGSGMALSVWAGEGNITVDLNGCEIVDNDGAADLVSLLKGDAVVNVADCLVNGNEEGILVDTFNGTVDVSIVDSQVMENDYSCLYVDSSGDIVVDVTNSSLSNANGYGIELYTEGEVQLVMDGVTMDGASTMEDVDYWYEESDHDWELLVPSETSTGEMEYIDLPFTFPYGGSEYDHVYMAEYGYLTFEYYAGYNFDFWSMGRDMIVPAQGYFQAYDFPYCGWEVSNDSATFQWYVDDSMGLTDLFKVTLYPSGEIVFSYDEMETIDYENYNGQWGLVRSSGWYLNLGYELGDFYTADHSTVTFTPMYMSDGTAVYIWADEGVNATVTDSHFANYDGDTLYLECMGEMSVDVSDSTFFNVGYGPYLDNYNGTVDVSVTGCDLSYVNWDAIYVYSQCDGGGEDSVVISDNTFSHSYYGIEIYQYGDSYYLDTYDRDVTWTVVNNTFVDVYDNYFYLDVENEDGNATVALDMMMSGNTFEELDGYMAEIEVEVSTEYGDLDHSESIVIDDNVVAGEEDGLYLYSECDVEFGDLTVDSHVSVANNEMTLDDAQSALLLHCDDEVVDGNATVTRDIQVLDNSFLGYYDGEAIDIEIDESSEYYYDGGHRGKGDYDCAIALDIIGNEVNYSDEDAIDVEIDGYVYNVWGDMVLDVDSNIVSNVLHSCRGIEFDCEADVEFWDYYPAYGEPVSSSATCDLAVLVDSNVLDTYRSGIYIDGFAYAYEGDSSNFAHASADLVADMDIIGNEVSCGYEGIMVMSGCYADGGMAEASSVSDVKVDGNTVSMAMAMGPLAPSPSYGIVVMENAMAECGDDEFTDAPSAVSEQAASVTDNVIDGAGNGIVFGDMIGSSYGGSAVDSSVVADVSGNTLTNISGEGIVGVSVIENDQYSSYGVSSNATVNSDLVAGIDSNIVEAGGNAIEVDAVYDPDHGINGNTSFTVDITSNTIVCEGYGVKVGGSDLVYDEFGGYYLTEDIIVTTIVDNDINGAEEGISVSYGHTTITDNVLTDCGDGVSVLGDDATVADNTISAEDTAIEVNEGNYTVTGNAITAIGEEATGIYAQYSVSTVSDNHIVDCYVGAYFYQGNVTFASNTIEGGDYGLGLDAEYAWVNDNVITGCSVYGLTDSAPFLAGAEDAAYEIVGNTFDGNQRGAYLVGSDILFAENTVINSVNDGAYFLVSSTTVEDNLFSDNGAYGLHIYDCVDVIVANNTFTANDNIGLYVESSSDVSVVNGVYSDNLGDGLYSYCDIDWTVNGVSEVRNNDVYFYGTLNIVEGGELTLVNVPIFGVRGSPGEIIVEEGGSLVAINSVIGDDLHMSPSSTLLFEVHGALEMENAQVIGAQELYLGPTSEATIANSHIAYMQAYGIYVDDCSPEITNTYIVDNRRDGVYVTGANAAPVIMGCFISENWRGMYVYQASMADVVDNFFFDNRMAGVYLEQVTGSVHDNVFLFNTKEIFVKDCDVSIVDNEIGYGNAASYMVELMAMSEAYEMLWYDHHYMESTMSPEPEMGWFMDIIDPAHIGIYADTSTVTAMDNVYGLVYTAVYCVDSTLSFSDSVESNEITVPYVTVDLFGVSLANMTFDAQVFDGIKARNSDVTVSGAYFDVLDDAIFLDGSTAEVSDTVFDADDNDVYLMGDSSANTHGTDLGDALVEAGSNVMAYKVIDVHLVNEDNVSVEGASVEVISSDGLVVASGETDANGDYSAEVLGAHYTGDGVEEMDYTVNVTHKSQKVSMAAGDDMQIELPGSGELLDNDTAFIVAIAVAALLAVALVAVAFKKD